MNRTVKRELRYRGEKTVRQLEAYSGYRCPKCGAPLFSKIQDDKTTIKRCMGCDYTDV